MFKDINGKEWRNLSEQVLKNKTDITKIVQGNVTLAEFGIKVINVSFDGTQPSLPPEPIGDEDNTYGYAWLVRNAQGTFDMFIWTREDLLAETGIWVNIGEFPKAGPTGNTGGVGPAGEDGEKGDTGSRGAKITSGTSVPQANIIEGDLFILLPSYDLYHYNGTQWSVIGNIKGATGATGTAGTNGTNGVDGIDGKDGVSVSIQDGIYTIATLPNFSATEAGDAYLVLDSTDRYDFYYHGIGGTDWTIINDWGGIPGPTGPQGLNGIGVPIGGTANQALIKINEVDYNTKWATLTKALVGLPNVQNPNQYGGLGLGGQSQSGVTFTDCNTLIITGHYSAYGDCTNVPNAAHSWYIIHVNSNVGTNDALQLAYSSDNSDLYMRKKVNNNWMAWENISPSLKVDKTTTGSIRRVYGVNASNEQELTQIENTPTASSTKLVTSGGIKTALDDKATFVTFSPPILLFAPNWAPSGDDVYEQYVEVSGVLATDKLDIDLDFGGFITKWEVDAMLTAWSKIYRAESGNNLIKFYATEIPEDMIKVNVKVVR